jgi:hypothetical protein
MPLPELRSSAAYENFINDHRFKSTETTVYLNNKVEDNSFHTDQLIVRNRSCIIIDLWWWGIILNLRRRIINNLFTIITAYGLDILCSLIT